MPKKKKARTKDKRKRQASLTEEASKLVTKERYDQYGPPVLNMAQIAKVWSGILLQILEREITPKEVALMMSGLKLCREANHHKRDNLVDVIGYSLIAEIAQAEHEQNQNWEE